MSKIRVNELEDFSTGNIVRVDDIFVKMDAVQSLEEEIRGDGGLAEQVAKPNVVSATSDEIDGSMVYGWSDTAPLTRNTNWLEIRGNDGAIYRVPAWKID